MHLNRQKAAVAGAIHRQKVHSVGGSSEHALARAVCREAVIGLLVGILAAGEEGLDFLDALGVGRGDHLGHLHNPVRHDVPVDVLVIQLANVIRDPVLLHGEKADERGFARALSADQHEHQLKFAAGVEHPVDCTKHEHAQALLIEVADVRAKKVVQGFAHAGHAVPSEAVQIIPDGMEMVLIGDDFQRVKGFLFRRDAVVPLQVQQDMRDVLVGKQRAFPPPGHCAHNVRAAGQLVPADFPLEDGVIAQDELTVGDGVCDAALVGFFQPFADSGAHFFKLFLSHRQKMVCLTDCQQFVVQFCSPPFHRD